MKLKTGWPSDVISTLGRQVRRIIGNNKVYEFYVGRTINLQESQWRHGCDDIIPLYKTRSIDHAIEVEGAMIEIFFDHPKCSNDSPYSGGGVSEGYTNYVYVAVWYR